MDICAYHIARRASAYKWFFLVFFYNHYPYKKKKTCPLLSRLFQWNFRVLSTGGKLSRVFFEIFRLTTLKSLSACPEIPEFAVSETKIRQFSGQNRAVYCVIQSISHRHSLPFASPKATSWRTENSCRTSDLL